MTLGLRFKCLLAVLTLCVCWEDGAEAVTKLQLTYIAGRIAEIHGKVNRTSVRLTDTSLSLRAMASRGLPSVHLLTQPTFRHTPVHNVRTTQQPPAVCPAGYRPLVGTCIRLVSQELSHDGARLACLEDGAILAMPKTRELDVALRELVRTDGGNEDYWIGMWEGTGYTDWQWMDGSQLHTYDYQQRVKGCLKSISPPVPVERWLNIESPGHTVDLEGLRILDTKQDYFKRGIIEAIYIRALQPSLNRDGRRYRLQTTLDPLLTSHAWNPGEPSNVDWLLWDNCVQYWSEPTGYPLWDDADCFYYKRYICQAARL
ncbi:hypothetical protein Bbelb_382050 [Branchiostoma belcheri]|nr:hypothetical protein Bbelb_382050 [Branchiostoma belcheri]